MGRIGGWFKKSDDKEKPTSNPYAQQPPVTQQQPAGQHSPPPEYDQYSQYNGSQYNANQRLPHANQGAPSGLPSGPRPGGHPSMYAQGPSRTDTWDSKKSAPPRYNEQSDHTAPPPSYNGNPSLPSAGRSPALSSNQASPAFAPNRGSPALSSTGSPSLGTGYPREKYGAADGVGGNRFDLPATSRNDSQASLPSQRQGGYGGLDTGRRDLFAGYNGPRNPTTSSHFGQSGAPNGASMVDGDSQPMSEEERQQAEVDGIKMQIEAENEGTIQSGRRALGGMREGIARFRATNELLLRDSEVLANVEDNAGKTKTQAAVGNVHLDELDAANTSMFNLVANSKAKVAYRAEKRMVIQQQHQARQAQTKQEEGDIHQRLDAKVRDMDARKPKGLLGASNNKPDFNKWEFEDDTGVQRAQNEETNELFDELYAGSQELRREAEIANILLTDQLKQVNRITDTVQEAGDRVGKNQIRLDTKYNKK